MLILLPPFCPRAGCPSRTRSCSFTYCLRGQYKRKCDGQTVQRFQCGACVRGFSEQTFRVNYRLKRPDLLAPFFIDRVSKVTHRQSARNHACSRGTEERHFRRLSEHCEAFHAARLSEVAAGGGLGEIFLLDELETYEEHRTKKPVTVPVLIERVSGFVIDTRVGTLPARRRPGAAKPPLLEGEVERKSESREVVKAAFERLNATSPKDRPIRVLTDEKHSYAQLLVELFGERCKHERTSSKRRRDVSNPLWPINHTLARVRDNVSRLVRETWAAAKLRRWLAGQLAIWVCYRNYVRGRTNREEATPAMVLKVQGQPWSVPGLLERRVFPAV
ncbi:MAG TPA: hypothetical protein VK843_02735 [Planctomycetota bacterium]|nr:hypothetical protein [Planctomycetota bacterium]